MWFPFLDWWVYLVIALSIFIGCLSLNFFVKKINETHIAERFHKLSQKTSTSQSTQVQYPLIVMETSRAPKLTKTNSDEIGPAVKGISLVFDKEENLLNEKKRAIEEDLIQHVEQILTIREGNVEVVKKSETVNSASEKNTEAESIIDVTIKPTFLGNIYKSANNSVCNYRMIRDYDQDSILNDLLDKIMSKVNDVNKSTSSIKSTPSVKECNVAENIKE